MIELFHKHYKKLVAENAFIDFDDINIFRIHENEKQTLGFCWVQNADEKFFPPLIFFTLELPWKENRMDISRIEPGRYQAKKYLSKKHGPVILLQDVSNRDWIEIHSMNTCLDTRGCIGVGELLADLNMDGIPDLQYSRRALKRILSVVPGVMTINIQDCFEEEK